MDSKKTFLKDILDYYDNISDGSISNEIIKSLSCFLADHFYYRYKDFRRQYPKSKKRYSKMKIDDLETTYTHDKIIEFLKKASKDSYTSYCSTLFKMSVDDFIEYEKNRNQFYDMF